MGTTIFLSFKGAFSGGKRSGAGPKKKLLKRDSFGAVGKIMLPSEGGKHISKKLSEKEKWLVSCRMEIQQNLKAAWLVLENIMTIDEETKKLSAKAAKASQQVPEKRLI